MNMSRASSGAKLECKVEHLLGLESLKGYEKEVSEFIVELYRFKYNGWANTLVNRVLYGR